MPQTPATPSRASAFSHELAEHAGSLPRPALVQELDRLLFTQACHFVLLLGGPGRGKSALVTQYLAHLEAGHGGASGRFEFLKEIALDYAFAIWAIEGGEALADSSGD